MSASKKSMMASGMSPSAPSHSGGCSHDTGASQMPLGDSHDSGDCDPCLRTVLLPISPTGHAAIEVCLATPQPADSLGGNMPFILVREWNDRTLDWQGTVLPPAG
jgi:hypothetical protein